VANEHRPYKAIRWKHRNTQPSVEIKTCQLHGTLYRLQQWKMRGRRGLRQIEIWSLKLLGAPQRSAFLLSFSSLMILAS